MYVIGYNDECKSNDVVQFLNNNGFSVECVYNVQDETTLSSALSAIKSSNNRDCLDLLTGAAEIIKKYKPRMAISIYHKLTDYYDLILHVKELVPEYQFQIRHHSTDFQETVLYAYT